MFSTELGEDGDERVIVRGAGVTTMVGAAPGDGRERTVLVQ